MLTKDGNVLVVEDERVIAHLIQDAIGSSDTFRFDSEHAGTLKKALDALKNNKTDIVLLDLNLPDSNGPDTFRKIHAKFPDVPIIIISSINDEKMATELVKEGAHDYLVKGQLDILALARVLKFALVRSGENT